MDKAKTKDTETSSQNKKFQIQIDNQYFYTDESVTNGKKILELAKKEPVDDYQLFEFLSNGIMKEVSLNETVDLKQSTIKFFSSKKGQTFKFELDGQIFEWGIFIISGRTLKDFSKVDPNEYGVWQEIKGQDDRPIANTSLVDLKGEQLERFYTGIIQTTEGEVE